MEDLEIAGATIPDLTRPLISKQKNREEGDFFTKYSGLIPNRSWLLLLAAFPDPI